MNTSKALVLFAISTGGMLIFAALYFSSPKTPIYTTAPQQIVTNTVFATVVVTNEIVREVPKEVEKIVNVPADIPYEYYTAMETYQKITNATFVDQTKVLFNMKDVRVVYILDDVIKQVVTEDEVRAKFELTLRRNNVSLNSESQNVVVFSASGFWNDNSQMVLCEAIVCEVYESQWIFRQGQCHRSNVRVWSTNGSHGTDGKYKANEAILGNVVSNAEIFANDFLSANPK